ncbi:helix-turn-helix domain-containing protein [Paenibacillus doosanensis]|uniref:helix-turn-helix domain-containing protein n=1 Tax=Paenibacillus doosanensis TaxID=1229154 RepID=UPI0021803A9A|nr:helix-turn-helix domain-containing protein [Paenibacillus doosanensis]MCS7459146.1 helix-turn-helix domain-containing protein [Paenibacillus doosanensis]
MSAFSYHIDRMKHVLFLLDFMLKKQCPPRWGLRRRAINRHYLVFVAGGSLELNWNGAWLTMEAGKYALLVPGDVVEARAVSAEPPEIVLLAFAYYEAPARANAGNTKRGAAEEPAADAENASLFGSRSRGLQAYGAPVMKLLRQLEAAAEERDDMGQWRRNMLLQQLFFAMAGEARSGARTHGGMREAIRRLVAYLDEHYMQEDLSLQALAESYGISWSNFSGIFKKYVGVRPIDYLTRLRMNHAKARLLQPLRMEEVARQVGYRDPLYFSRIFKKTIGVSPSVYRKNLDREHIVTLSPHVNDYLLALELQPFATLPYAGNDQLDGLLPYIADKLKDIRIIGERPQDWEALIRANPRMILGSDGGGRARLSPLSNIAPTVNVPLKDDWRSLLFELSALLDRKAQYTRWIRHFEQKAAGARRRLSRELRREETVMVLIASANELRVYGGRRQLGEILYRELGLLPPRGITLQDHYTCVTPEQLIRFDPDHIFLATTNSNLNRAQVRELLESDAWHRLSAVRKGNVYEVQSWLNGHAPIQHSLSIDIALSHLLKGASR